MKYHHLFQVKQDSSSDDAIEELSAFLTDIYEMTDPETKSAQIAGYSEGDITPSALLHSTLEISSPVEEIDWQQQWADFAPHFQDGLAHISLGGTILLLKPGAGFGDLSHPTTRLVMTLMAPLVKDQVVFDIGCGSGILSIAAALLGAAQVYGIDIDEDAIKHSQENAKINCVATKTHFSKEIDPAWVPKEPFLIVMNMISSEQSQAWQALSALHKKQATIVISGLLSMQRDLYVQFAKDQKWSLVQELEEEGWAGFIFSQTP